MWDWEDKEGVVCYVLDRTEIRASSVDESTVLLILIDTHFRAQTEE